MFTSVRLLSSLLTYSFLITFYIMLFSRRQLTVHTLKYHGLHAYGSHFWVGYLLQGHYDMLTAEAGIELLTL